ncbi:MAG TPA: hypothetical protein VF043_01805 [Ktedonobacteraceae bacterium]
MIAFFYGEFSYFFMGCVVGAAGYGFFLFYKGRQLLHDIQPHGEQLSGQAQRMMRMGMSMILTVLSLLVLFSIVGIISHKLAVVLAVLIASAIGTLLSAVLFTVTSREHLEK